jgi:hypothetical protein
MGLHEPPVGGLRRSCRSVSTRRLWSLEFLGETVPRLVLGEGGRLVGCRATEHCHACWLLGVLMR